MNVIRVSDSKTMSCLAADVIAAQIIKKSDTVLGLATGSTPIGTYEKLIEKHKDSGLSFEQVKSFNLDEYAGISADHPQSYLYFMMDNLFSHVNIDKANINIPNGMAEDLDLECSSYDARIEAAGGIDLQLLGIGNNGHIGFNEPGDRFILPTHVIDISQNTIEANSRFFDSIDDVPKKALTMGIGAIMRAKSVLLVAAEGKSDIVEKAVYGDVTPDVPASILQLHPDVTIIYVK